MKSNEYVKFQINESSDPSRKRSWRKRTKGSLPECYKGKDQKEKRYPCSNAMEERTKKRNVSRIGMWMSPYRPK